MYSELECGLLLASPGLISVEYQSLHGFLCIYCLMVCVVFSGSLFRGIIFTWFVQFYLCIFIFSIMEIIFN